MGVGVGCYALEVSQYLPVPGVVWFEFIKAILCSGTVPGTGINLVLVPQYCILLALL